MKLAINLNKKQQDNFLAEFEKLGHFGLPETGEIRKQKYYSKDNIIKDLKDEYADIIIEEWTNSDYKDYTKEELFLAVYVNSGNDNFSRHILYFAYYESYTKNNPKIALNGINTFNNLFAISPKPYNDSVGIFNLIYYYAGNQFTLAENYLDTYFPKDRVEGNHFGDLLPLSLKILKDKEPINECVAKLEYRISTKQSKFWKFTLQALKALLQEDTIAFSENLALLMKHYARVGELHNWTNQMNKYFPLYIYGIYAMAYRYLKTKLFEQIETPDHNLWWEDFAKMNRENNFEEGEPYINFMEELSFLNTTI